MMRKNKLLFNIFIVFMVLSFMMGCGCSRNELTEELVESSVVDNVQQVTDQQTEQPNQETTTEKENEEETNQSEEKDEERQEGDSGGNEFNNGSEIKVYRKFYICFRDYEIVNACVHNLTWTHFRRVLAVASQESREWYIREASEQQWSTRELDRNISTQYYERLLSSQREGLSLRKAESGKADPLDYIKSPVVAEFLGFHNNSDYNESQLEQALIDNLEKFIMELGKRCSFVYEQIGMV